MVIHTLTGPLSITAGGSGPERSLSVADAPLQCSDVDNLRQGNASVPLHCRGHSHQQCQQLLLHCEYVIRLKKSMGLLGV